MLGDNTMANEVPLIDMNKEQVKNILKYIDSMNNRNIKRDIFCQLGNECFNSGHTKEWVMGFKNDYQSFIDNVNIKDMSPYWEKFEFNEDKSILYLTGKKVTQCVCAFGNTKNPPESLCKYCCKTFQEKIFRMLFNRNVNVEITESSILGGERCNTAIHIL
jgi:hypothetical protein